MPELFAEKPHNAENMISFHTLNLDYPWVEFRNSEVHEHSPPNKALARQGHGKDQVGSCPNCDFTSIRKQPSNLCF